MKYRAFLILLFALSFFKSEAKFSCYLYVNTHDCSSCLSNIDLVIKLLPDTSEKYFVFNKEEISDSETIVKRLMLNKYHHCNVVWEEKAKKNDPSFAVVKNEFGFNFSFYLSSANENIKVLEKFTKPIDYIIDNAEENIGNCKIKSYGASLYLQDDNTGKIVEINRVRETAYSYVLKDSLIKEIYQRRFGNLDNYQLSKTLLDRVNIVDRDKFSDYSIYKDTLFILSLNIMPSVRGVGDTIITKEWTVLKYQNGKLLGICPVIHRLYVADHYLLRPTEFLVDSTNYYFNLVRDSITSTHNNFIAKFSLKKDFIEFDKILEDTLPHDYLVTHLFYDFTDIQYYANYFMLPISNELRNVRNNKLYTLDKLFMDELHPKTESEEYIQQRSVWDIKIDKDFIGYFVTVEHDNYYYVKYDIKNNKELFRKRLGKYPDIKIVPKIDKADFDYVFISPSEHDLVRKRIDMF